MRFSSVFRFSALTVLMTTASTAAYAACNASGNIISSNCSAPNIHLYGDAGVSALELSDITVEAVELKPDNTVTDPTRQSLSIGSGTVISNTTGNNGSVISQTYAAGRDLDVVIDSGAQISGTSGYGGVWLKNDTSGNLSVQNSGIVDVEGVSLGGDGTAAITASTNSGSVYITNDGTATSAQGWGIYADAGYNDSLVSSSMTRVVNTGDVDAYIAGIRAIQYNGAANIYNSGEVVSETRQGLVAWAQEGSAYIRNSGLSIARDDIALAAFADVGNVTVINSGTLEAYDNTTHTDSGAGHYGIQAQTDTGDISISNTSSGTISAPDDYAIYASSTVAGNIDVTNLGVIEGQNGILASSADGHVSIINSGTISATTGSGIQSQNLTLENTGSIYGAAYGLFISGDTVVSNNGLIGGDMGAAFLFAGGNTFNVTQASRFEGVIDYNSTSGNTTSFGAGSYRLHVAQYLDADNAITLNNGSQKVVLDNASSTSGYINVVAIPAASHVATQYTSGVSDVIGSILSLDVARPDIATVDAPTMQPLQYAREKPQSEAAKAVHKLGDGTAVDAYGNLMWVRAFGGLRYLPSSDGETGNHASHYGMIAGVDRQFDTHRFGVFGGAGRVRSDASDGSSELRGDTGFLGIYGAGEYENIHLNGSITAGGIHNTTKRSINTGAQTAEGDYDGWYVSPEFSVSREYRISPDLALTGRAKLRYTGAFFEGYQETGSSQNIDYASQESHSIDGRLELELAKTLVTSAGLPAKVTVTGSVLNTHYLGSGNLRASLDNNEFNVSSGRRSNVLGAGLGLGFDAALTKRVNAYGGVDAAVYNDDSKSLSGRLGVKVAF